MRKVDDSNEVEKEEVEEFVCSGCGKKFTHIPILIWDSDEWVYEFCGNCFAQWMNRNNLKI